MKNPALKPIAFREWKKAGALGDRRRGASKLRKRVFIMQTGQRRGI